MGDYGYFDDNAREYVITNPHTPLKWINYVGTLAFGGFVDHTGGALICKDDPGLNRLTKYIPQLPSADFKGTTLYFRLHTESAYTVFSPYYTPCLAPFDRYECRVGMGYTTFITETNGIRAEITVFVPKGDSRLLRDIRVTNISDTPVILDAVPVVEWSHFNALRQYDNADWVPQTMRSEHHTEDGNTVLVQYAFMNRDLSHNYFTANIPASSFDTDRRAFLGANGYGSWAHPLGLDVPELSNSVALRGDNIAALLLPLGTLEPGQTTRFVTQLGQATSINAARDGIRQFYDPGQVDAAYQSLCDWWQNYLDLFAVQTPDAALNSMLNVFNPRQAHTTKNWSRYLSLYQLGLGSRGIGSRDSAQDVLGVMAHIPDQARDLITTLLHVQCRDGHAMHQLFPLTMQGSQGEATEPGRPDFYSDDHLWSILAICAYIKETGDTAYLDHVVPFYDRDPGTGQTIESGTIRAHMDRGIHFTQTNLGRHNIPLAGFADWNDTMNFPTGAESLFTANLYGRALLELIALYSFLEEDNAVEQYIDAYEAMLQTVNAVAWDGEWYIRYFDHAGQPVGSASNHYGQIFTNGQSWPVLSGFADENRAIRALDSLRGYLNTKKGIKLSTPGYDGFDPDVGGASTYPPGAKENGGIFLHANPWVVIAETMLGRGDRAYEYYSQINPAAKNDIIDEYEVEPYVYCQNILGDEHPQFGAGRNSWLSGTAAWMYIAGTQYILGIRPQYNGLLIDPCIPVEWDGFTARRQYRGATYAITIQNPSHVNKGVATVTVDGDELDSNLLPVFDSGEHKVVVVMG